MKPLLTAALMFLATMAGAATPAYYGLQHYLVKPDTTTINTKYEFRGDFKLGRDTFTASLDAVPKNVVLLSSGTIWAKRIEGDIYGTVFTTITVANVPASGVLAGSLPSNVIASSIAVNAVGPAQMNFSGTKDSTHFFAGDGTMQTTGTGDMVLAATQTVTGTNTFTAPIVANGGITTGRKMWQVIFSTSIGTAVSSYTVSGLNGNADVEYKIETCLKCSSSAGDYWIYFNGDTATNRYGTNRISSNGTTVTPNKSSNNWGFIGYGGTTVSIINMEIHARINTITPYAILNFQGGDYNTYFSQGVVLWGAGTNINNFTIFNDGDTMSGDITVWALR